MAVQLLLAVASSLLPPAGTAGRAAESEERLVAMLFNTSRYNPLIRPARTVNEVVTVNFRLSISQLISVRCNYRRTASSLELTRKNYQGNAVFSRRERVNHGEIVVVTSLLNGPRATDLRICVIADTHSLSLPAYWLQLVTKKGAMPARRSGWSIDLCMSLLETCSRCRQTAHHPQNRSIIEMQIILMSEAGA
ncbi:Neuronal acetylcholine receptor subunit beta-4 [Branchiostoma belcheri]|nr:Neuronal acetylcholine receptor subunit beta-4 [Branchiostoma belcheri]